MATTLPPQSDLPQSLHLQPFPLGLSVTELDLRDNRYPSISPTLLPHPQSSGIVALNPPNRTSLDSMPAPADAAQRTNDTPRRIALSPGWTAEPLRDVEPKSEPEMLPNEGTAVQQSQLSDRARHESSVSYALPPGAQAARRVVERYSLDDGQGLHVSGVSGDARQLEPTPQAENSSSTWQTAVDPVSQPLTPSAPRHPSLPAAGIGVSGNYSPVTPVVASPPLQNRSSHIPVSSTPRAFPQQPTYVSPSNIPIGMSPTLLRNNAVPQEEVCLECAMRDQDMADVDVTSPGIWDRESDVLYEELIRREQEEKAAGVVSSDSSQRQRPRAKGGLLTEANLKIWLSINPREPTSRQRALETYVKSQRMLLEAEAMAHSRALHESRQLDSKMRDAYSQLRRSAYDTGASAVPIDDGRGVRIKSPSQSSRHTRSHSRDVTLLESGMIVEHVDVRRERREERERRRKEEKRERSQARKSSRSSAVDVKSIISVNSISPQTDSPRSPGPYSRYSTNVTRPTSVLTAPVGRRPSLPQAYSQASLSEVQSLGPPSPRSRSFGFRNLSAGWRSQDSLAPSRMSGMSGSMMNMHVVFQPETQRQQGLVPSTFDIPPFPSSHSANQAWLSGQEIKGGENPKKKKSGLARMWRRVTGSKKNTQMTYHESPRRHEEDVPLAPPPPLSYLVDRRPGELDLGSGRHASTPSLLSATSPKNPLVPPVISPMSLRTAPSSSAASSRRSAGDQDKVSNEKKGSINHDDQEQGSAEANDKTTDDKAAHPVSSEPDIRRSSQPPQANATSHQQQRSPPSTRPHSVVVREKSLPPLPDEPKNSLAPVQREDQLHTLLTYDLRHIPLDSNAQRHDFFPPHVPFRDNGNRPQSFGGTTSRPTLPLQTMPQNGIPDNVDLHQYPRNGYNEFGHSYGSLGRLSKHAEHAYSPHQKTPKRRSKFSFASILGRKSSMADPTYLTPQLSPHSQEFPTMTSRRSHADDEALSTSGYALSVSKHSALSAGPRMSLASRKAIEELVSQDPEFVAYRYPSSEQRLDLLR